MGKSCATLISITSSEKGSSSVFRKQLLELFLVLKSLLLTFPFCIPSVRTDAASSIVATVSITANRIREFIYCLFIIINRNSCINYSCKTYKVQVINKTTSFGIIPHHCSKIKIIFTVSKRFPH